MRKVKALTVAVGDLVQEKQVHSSLYTDGEIFAEELKRIWYRSWILVGHESEVAEPNDYVRKAIGPQDLIMVRDRDGSVRLLFNRCPHRANLVCEDQRGNSSSFRCAYHGWTFRNTGDLLGYPFRSGYEGDEEVRQLGLARAHVGIYRGFVFGNLSPDEPVESLEDSLGAAAAELDRLADLSPEGELTLTAGWLRHHARGNWKLLYENDIDGYHPLFVHESVLKVSDSPVGDLYSDRSAVLTRDLGSGHSDKDMRPTYRDFGKPLLWMGATEEKVPDYVRKMRESYGESAEERLTDGPPTLGLFPNVFIGEIHISIFQPISPDITIQHVTPVQFKGAPEVNRRILRQTVGSVGPAGMFLADDMEMHDRCQRGVTAIRPEWVQVGRGLHRERVTDDGFRVGRVTDETGMRAFWRRYVDMMPGASLGGEHDGQ